MKIKTFSSEFWIGDAPHRTLVKTERLSATHIDRVREVIPVLLRPDNTPGFPPGAAITLPLLVICREVEPTVQEKQVQIKLL